MIKNLSSSRNMSTEFTEFIPSLPEELALECLTRLNYASHRVAASVCHRWRELLHSRDFYLHRKRAGFTRKAAVLVQLGPQGEGLEGQKPARSLSYGLTVYDPVSGSWDRVDPVPKYPTGLPLFCQVASSEGKLVVMGGWDPATWEPVRDVFVYEFTTRTWSRRKDMPSCRSFFAAAAIDGAVIVAGGHDEGKNALATAWAYDIREDEWTELTRMSEERDECEGIVIGSEFWVVSGYPTESQGGFNRSAEAFGPGGWRRAEDAWAVSQCPRSSAGWGENGGFFSWTGFDPAVRVGACGVELGGLTLVTGSEYQGGPHGFYLVERKKDGQRGKLVKIEVPEEFSGFVQSGCCVEI